MDVINNKAIALALAGQKQDALKLLEKGLSIDPKNRYMLEVRSQLQKGILD